MSEAAFEHSREVRTLCQSCQDRKARFRFRGIVKADRDHTLCFQCFRSERDRRRAQMLADVASPPPLRSSLGDSVIRPQLTASQTAHRRRMLEYLATAPPARSDATGA